MALLFFDGFDHYGVGGDPSSVGFGKWGPGTNASAQSAVVRTGTLSLRLGISSSLTTKPLVASGGAVVGMAVYVTNLTATDLIQVLEGAVVHVAVALTAGGLLTVKRGTTVLATGTTVLSVNSWYYLELKTVIHDTAGSYELHIDGVTELIASSVDTRNAGTTGQWDRVLVSYNANLLYIDDFYVCDLSGSAPYNTFLGSVKVETLYPQTDAVAAGSNAALTPSTGTDHGAMVDETAPNQTDYNSSATVGAKDTYNYPSMALTGTILAVQTNLYCQKSDASARSVCGVLRVGSTDYDGANASPLTTWSYLTEVRALNPATSAAWTVADITALQAGMKVTV